MWRILDFLFPPREDEAALRGIATDDFLSLLAPKLVEYTRPGTVALLSFGDPVVRSALHEAKYHGSVRAFTLLGAVLAEYLQDADELPKKSIIVPIPLGSARQKVRGHNQVEEILRHIGLQIVVDTGLLIRVRETASQVSLPRDARRENMCGAFGATHPLDPAYTYIVVDDVTTTGATLQAAIDALTASGATHIIPLALAH